jgi:hypothetical protein
MSSKRYTLAFRGFTPGPDGDANPVPGVQVGPQVPTDLTQRICDGMSYAAPVQQLTPTQQAFMRANADGRWPADYNTGAISYVHAAMQDPKTGAIDVIRMEPWTDDDAAVPVDPQYLDLGGRGGVDYAARRP